MTAAPRGQLRYMGSPYDCGIRGSYLCALPDVLGGQDDGLEALVVGGGMPVRRLPQQGLRLAFPGPAPLPPEGTRFLWQAGGVECGRAVGGPRDDVIEPRRAKVQVQARAFLEQDQHRLCEGTPIRGEREWSARAEADASTAPQAHTPVPFESLMDKGRLVMLSAGSTKALVTFLTRSTDTTLSKGRHVMASPPPRGPLRKPRNMAPIGSCAGM